MSIKWSYKLILKCDIKDCKSNREFFTEMGKPKSLESAARMCGWDFSLAGITICPKCNKRRKKYVNEQMAKIK